MLHFVYELKYGKPHWRSDIDLAVVVPSESDTIRSNSLFLTDVYGMILEEILEEHKIPVKGSLSEVALVMVTPGLLQSNNNQSTDLFKNILRGKTLYARYPGSAIATEIDRRIKSNLA